MEGAQKPATTPTPFTDVARPGATPANPSSRPIITANTPEQKDPMMTTATVSRPATPPAPEPAVNPAVPQMTVPSDTSHEPAHKFTHDEGHIGHVGKRPIKKQKFIIGFLIMLSFGFAFYIMFIRT